MSELIASYKYVDPTSGQLLATKRRYEEAGEKTFEWLRPDSRKPGLGGSLKEADLPLYNVQLLREWDVKKAIFFVEGEKAADALLESYNALAVCLPGGANTRKFGASLDSLRDRDVVLWPDDDEQGITLMRRLKSELEPIAKRVRVFLPQGQRRHDDAYDYVKRGHSRRALERAISGLSNEPQTERVPDGFVFTYPDIGSNIKFRFTNIRYQVIHGQEGVWAKVGVWEEVPDRRSGEPWNHNLNLGSSSSRDGASASLQKLFGGDGAYWTRLVHKACSAIIEQTDKDESHFIDLLELPKSLQVTYLVDKFLPDSGATIFYGRGDRGKTTLATMLGICVATGTEFLGRAVKQAPVVYINFEGEDDDDARRRVRRLADGAGIALEEIDKHFFYKNARGQRLEQILPNLRAQVEERGVGLVIVDSISKISVGDIERHDAPNFYYGLLDTLKVPTFSLGHVPKPPSHRNWPDHRDPEYPFGSTYFRDLARTGWQVHRYNFDERDVAHLVMLHRKYNTTGQESNFGVNVSFTNKRGVLPTCRIGAEEVDVDRYARPTQSQVDVNQLILNELVDGPKTATEIAEALDKPIKTVKNHLTELRRDAHIEPHEGSQWRLPDGGNF